MNDKDKEQSLADFRKRIEQYEKSKHLKRRADSCQAINLLATVTRTIVIYQICFAHSCRLCKSSGCGEAIHR